ncbi:MAG TPA: phytanoyl-CoA dioxygenase family protein [Pseudomonadales bacterium]
MDEVESTYQALTHGNGYSVLASLLTPDMAAATRQLLLDHAGAADHDDDGILRLPNLLSLDDVFSELVTHPRLLAVAHRLVGSDAKLAAVSGRILLPGCKLGGLHVDYPYWAMDPGMPVEPAMMLQVIWMMEPFTAANGGTWVAPGSQGWAERPRESRFREQAIQATGNAGDAVVSHGLLWHRTAVNRTGSPRVALLINYAQLTIQPMTPMGPFTREYQDRASPALRMLLDLDHGKSLRRRLSVETNA